MTDEMSTSLTNATMAEKGEIIKGTVLKVEDKHALVDISAKQDAFLPINEVSSLFIEKVSDVLNEGDRITVKVLSHTEDKLLVSKKAVDTEKSWSELEEKFNSKETFEVVVHDVVKGGLVVDLGVRAFIPASMVESHFVEDFSDYKGKSLSVKIVELDAEKGRVILSHRAVTEETAVAKKQEILDRLAPGEIIEGKVQRLTDFGAFVDIGGVDGLVHVSQLSHSRVDNPSEVLSEGETVKVKVLSVDRDNDRISLSIKETQPGPWEEASSSIQAGSVIEGTVKRIVTFGAFVEVAPGIEGLVHISELANRHIGNPSEVVKEGQQVSVKVLEVNSQDKRMSLSMKAVQDEKEKANLKENLPKEEKGFSLADMIGDQLKGYK
ncbi:30S ribosomal protein S1 [Fictibacillus sp. 5RED26]|uniref:30S ribosomal protein S1 n=1 Tax=Fictibacillus TaxID=1329200 RepID=UPI0018CDFFF1|nr:MULTISPECIES: 30S ribosomal protein S1 [unclassified Fictibacillus]MBH0157477.1 30S ribosomal protein S1 [Fictibacillus sp. 5RED26]MBH0160291.1 30S ribosomal protein S1 [Fictibacillus sp. 26RED30]MBH0166582.1 30S ribosomal protein S1 [Fictibacillus sp. 7GRE50]MBH0174408.1 30S ribosomal protein S1 [Fictibacillus sp. 23RED33]